MRTNTTIKPMLPAKVPIAITHDEKLFCMFVGVLGLSASEAYRLAFPTKASNLSATAMASKLLRERHIQCGITTYHRRYRENGFAFNENAIKIYE